jgi:hypothetical protein
MSTALAPAATFLRPSAKIACASSVAVVVPSPTASPVRTAASALAPASTLARAWSRNISWL